MVGLGQSANRHLQIKERQRGFDESTSLESFVLLNAPGWLVHHAGKLVLNIGLAAERIRQWLQARPVLLATVQ